MFCEQCYKTLSSYYTVKEFDGLRSYEWNLGTVITGIYYDLYQESCDVKLFCNNGCKIVYESLHKPIHYSFTETMPILCAFCDNKIATHTTSADDRVCAACWQGFEDALESDSEAM